MRRGTLLATVLVIVLLAACGDDEEAGVELDVAAPTNDTSGEPAPQAWAFAGLPDPQPRALALPAVEGIEGQLVFMKEEGLYLGRFDGQEPLVLSNLVHPYLLSLSPDGNELVYLDGQAEEGGQNSSRREYMLSLLDLTTQASTPLVEVNPNRFLGIFHGWSPDGTTFMASNEAGLTLVRLDGSEPEPVPGLFSPAIWLEDGTLIVFNIQAGTENTAEPVLEAYWHNPATGERTMLDLELDTLAETPLDNLEVIFEPVFAHQGRTYAASYTGNGQIALLPAGDVDGRRVYIDVPPSAQGFEMPGCDVWTIEQRPRADAVEPETLATLADTVYLTDLTALPDGSLLFLRWTQEECHFTDEVVVDLMRLVPGEEPVVIASPIDPGANSNPNDLRMLRFWRGHKFAVTPDGHTVYWIGGGMGAGTSALHVTDLATGASARLLTATLELSGEGSFENVFWLP